MVAVSLSKPVLSDPAPLKTELLKAEPAELFRTAESDVRCPNDGRRWVEDRLTFDALGCRSMSDLAREVGVSLRTLHRWKRDGVPRLAADRVAVSLGFHPASIWPDW